MENVKFKNMAQLKKGVQVGMKLHIIENKLKPKNSGIVREIKKVQSNSLCGSLTEEEVKSWEEMNIRVPEFSFLDWQKASTTRLNNDGTIDFLFSEEKSGVSKKTIDDGTITDDFWLKIEILPC